MTKNIKTKSKREKAKYPALDKGLNTSSRKDYIEPEYINGVYDNEGNELIRPLTDDEKSFLNQYYEEAIVTNFYHEPELRRLNKKKNQIIEDDTVKNMQKRLKVLRQDKTKNKKEIRQLEEIIRLTKKQNLETYADQLEEIEQELDELRQEFLLYPDREDHKAFYNENNSRNNCLYNKFRSMNQLMFLDVKKIDYATLKLLEFESMDCEDRLIQGLESEIARIEDEEERLKAVKDFEKNTKKKKRT